MEDDGTERIFVRLFESIGQKLFGQVGGLVLDDIQVENLAIRAEFAAFDGILSRIHYFFLSI